MRGSWGTQHDTIEKPDATKLDGTKLDETKLHVAGAHSYKQFGNY